MCHLRSAALTGAVLCLLSMGSTAVDGVKDKVQHHHHHGHSRAASGGALHSSSPLVSALQETSSANPFLQPPLSDYMARFNIPEVHGSGIYVDLGNDKSVDGRTYREPSGRCPVFGKFIKLYQPTNNPKYANDFLADIPTKTEADAAGRPLPGGFNNSFKLPDKTSYSPMSATKLNSYKQLKASTPLGKCAEMSYLTTAGRNSSYRYPFVYDTENNSCYFLYISMQRLMGARYCSQDGKPEDMTWYCFEPQKDPTERTGLVYGSAYVGEDPDAWEHKCPNKAAKDVVFGVWDKGRCQEHRHRQGSRREIVGSKKECWALAFLNGEAASDHPVTEDENFGTFGYYFPNTEPNQPKSGGAGMNFASYYPLTKECWIAEEVPTCLVPVEGGVAYTALGSAEEEDPPCTDDFPASIGFCNPSTCMQPITSCIDHKLVATEQECIPEDGSKCEASRSNAMVIGLAAAGGILLLLLAGGAVALYRSKRKPTQKQEGATRSDYVQEEAAASRRKQRQSDLVQQAEPSFWEEAEQEDPDAAENTHVLVDEDY